MGYLDRLKKLDSGNCAPCVLPKLPKPPFDSKGSSYVARFQKTAPGNDAVVGADTAAASFDELFQERAAIYEFDAGFTRAEAERRAFLEVTKHG